MLATQLLAGAVVVLAFAGVQLRRLDPHGVSYLVANGASTGVLAAVALSEAQYGFVLTNGAWAVLSAFGLVRMARNGLAGGGQVDADRNTPPGSS